MNTSQAWIGVIAAFLAACSATIEEPPQIVEGPPAAVSRVSLSAAEMHAVAIAVEKRANGAELLSVLAGRAAGQRMTTICGRFKVHGSSENQPFYGYLYGEPDLQRSNTSGYELYIPAPSDGGSDLSPTEFCAYAKLPI